MARVLGDHHWPPDTAAAIVSAASLPDQAVWRGTLGDLASGAVELGGDAPAVILVGAVAALNLTEAVIVSERKDETRASWPNHDDAPANIGPETRGCGVAARIDGGRRTNRAP